MRPAQPRRRRWPWLALSGAAAVVAVAVGAVIILRPSGSSAAAWSRLGTEDVHSLAFAADDPDRLLFGHHGGISASSDGGRTWQPLGTRSDAMSLGAASDGSIVIAGHEVFAASRDDGRTWENIPATLPSLDIHGFARDPGDPARMWAYLATGGLWESRDAGLTWELVHQENVLFPVAVQAAGATRLFGVTVGGLAAADDGGRTWRSVATPELYPIASLAATTDGSVLVAGGPGGLARSDDGGASWSELSFDGEPAAIAVTAGGRTIAVVTRSTDYFRSDDGGQTWPAP
ncbi:MAG: exo-alpha-sialidase [Chloroflexi bacterium]|nr:exo-alpha-sialidase [Chloroflexota bacterium]